MQNIAKYFGILQNLGMGCGIGKKIVLWDRDDRISGYRIVMKKELECGITTPPYGP